MPALTSNNLRVISLKKLKLFALIEGITLVLLVGVAMPLKYFLEIPQATKIVGPFHGLAFLYFVTVIFENYSSKHIDARLGAFCFLMCFVPFGIIWTESKIDKQLDGN